MRIKKKKIQRYLQWKQQLFIRNEWTIWWKSLVLQSPKQDLCNRKGTKNQSTFQTQIFRKLRLNSLKNKREDRELNELQLQLLQNLILQWLEDQMPLIQLKQLWKESKLCFSNDKKIWNQNLRWKRENESKSQKNINDSKKQFVIKLKLDRMKIGKCLRKEERKSKTQRNQRYSRPWLFLFKNKKKVRLEFKRS